jgi:hypothetical protein
LYEAIETHAMLPAAGDAGVLQLGFQNAQLLPLATDDTLQLARVIKDPKLSCKQRISTVSVVVDLLPDANRTWLGDVAGGKWLDADSHSVNAFVKAISDAGAGPC